jgi:hypothetical protein
MPKANAWWTKEATYIDIYDQERAYREQTGDKEWFCEYERRVAEWLEKNPRRKGARAPRVTVQHLRRRAVLFVARTPGKRRPSSTCCSPPRRMGG